MTFEFLAPPCRRLRAALPAAAFDEALVLSGDSAVQPRNGQRHPLPSELVHSLARRIRAYAGGHPCATALETPGSVYWATFAPPLVAAVTLLRLPATRNRPESAPPRVLLGQPRAPHTSPHPGLSLLFSDHAAVSRAGYTLRLVASTTTLLAAALEVGQHVADATCLEASSLLDWPLLARHHRVSVYTACTTVDHALVALAPPEQHIALRNLLSTR